jgi:hypothetical protein
MEAFALDFPHSRPKKPATGLAAAGGERAAGKGLKDPGLKETIIVNRPDRSTSP